MFNILNVRSTIPPDDADLTAKARLVDAAIQVFGEQGMKASVREIAKRAGVSVGLINHHFGSKDGLRQACDAEVVRVTGVYKRESVVLGGGASALAQLAEFDDFAPYLAYTFQALTAGGPFAKAMIDSYVAEGEDYMLAAEEAGFLTHSVDSRLRVRMITYEALGSLVLFWQHEVPEGMPPGEAIRLYMQKYGTVLAEERMQPLMNPEKDDGTVLAAFQQYADAVAEGRKLDVPDDSIESDDPEGPDERNSHE